MAGAWLDELNPAQREAVTHAEGPLLVIAGAGTGKTRTLACRVACLIDRGVPADRILLLTFTRRAAAEMLSRAGRLTSQTTAGHVWGGTFHAVGNRLLRTHGEATAVDHDDLLYTGMPPARPSGQAGFLKELLASVSCRALYS